MNIRNHVYVRAIVTPELINLAERVGVVNNAAKNVPNHRWHHLRLRLADMTLMANFFFLYSTSVSMYQLTYL